MASVYDLKPRFQDALRPIVARLAGAGVSANQVTVAAVVVSALSGGAIVLEPGATWPLLALAPVLALRMALNAIDGMLAREHLRASRLGAMLNEVGDVVADVFLYLPLALVEGTPTTLLVLVVIGGVIVEMTGAIGPLVGAPRGYQGPLGKSDRALTFGAIGLVLGAGVAPGTWLEVVLAAMLALVPVTIVNRVRGALAEAGR